MVLRKRDEAEAHAEAARLGVSRRESSDSLRRDVASGRVAV